MRQYGWPPTGFIGQQRNRTVDSLLVTTMKWALKGLARVHASAKALFPSSAERVKHQLSAAFALLDLEPIASAEAIRPSAVDMRALRAEGTPWSYVANACDLLRQVEVSLLELAKSTIYPQPQLRGRLFHLAVLGLVLRSIRDLGLAITSRRPIGAPSVGPAYSIGDLAGPCADLWFEAAGAWSYYGKTSPYVVAAQGVEGAGSPLGADLMLLVPHRRVLLVECKYSTDAQIVARAGYEQAVAYAAEAANHLAPQVFSIVVGPDEVVSASHRTTLSIGTIAIAAPADLTAIVREFLFPPSVVV